MSIYKDFYEEFHYELGKKEGTIYKLRQCLDEIGEIINKYKVGSGNLYGTICIPDVIRIAEKIKEIKEE